MSTVPPPPNKTPPTPEVPDTTSKSPLGKGNSLLQFKVEDEIRHEFRKLAVDNRMNMSEMFLHIFQYFKKNK